MLYRGITKSLLFGIGQQQLLQRLYQLGLKGSFSQVTNQLMSYIIISNDEAWGQSLITSACDPTILLLLRSADLVVVGNGENQNILSCWLSKTETYNMFSYSYLNVLERCVG